MDKNYLLSAATVLELKEIPQWDFHIHTIYGDGKAAIENVFAKAIEKKCTAIAFTEHTEVWRHSQKDWFSAYCDDILKSRSMVAETITAFIGIEANTLDFNGNIELTPEMKNKAEFVLGAAHCYPGLGKRKTSELSHSEAIDLEFKTLMGLATSQNIDAIAHLGATCAKYCGPFPENLAREIIITASRNKVAIEINPVYHKPLLRFLEICAEEGAMVTLGSNAHGFNDIGLIYRELRAALKK